jgi:hypothetical protein
MEFNYFQNIFMESHCEDLIKKGCPVEVAKEETERYFKIDDEKDKLLEELSALKPKN